MPQGTRRVGYGSGRANKAPSSFFCLFLPEFEAVGEQGVQRKKECPAASVGEVGRESLSLDRRGMALDRCDHEGHFCRRPTTGLRPRGRCGSKMTPARPERHRASACLSVVVETDNQGPNRRSAITEFGIASASQGKSVMRKRLETEHKIGAPRIRAWTCTPPGLGMPDCAGLLHPSRLPELSHADAWTTAPDEAADGSRSS